jgi:BirA family biotin operon repressor/biotin-[acetyl-CoA-carboxylase] ligase
LLVLPALRRWKKGFVDLPKNHSSDDTVELLDKDIIQSHLHHQSIHIDVFGELESTNTYLMKQHHEDTLSRVCLAEVQTKGKGRFDRRWHSPFAKNIYFSLSCSFSKSVSQLSGLSLIVGLAVCKAIDAVCPQKNKLMIKWPNDVLVDQKKLSGILIEIKSNTKDACEVVIGIGINVNMENADKEIINQPWTSLKTLLGQKQSRNQLCAALIDILLDDLNRFKCESFFCFMNEWNKRDVLFGHSIQLLSNEKVYTGIEKGVSQQGHLLLQLPSGELKTFASGETSLLK